jgi:hypothetical protein
MSVMIQEERTVASRPPRRMTKFITLAIGVVISRPIQPDEPVTIRHRHRSPSPRPRPESGPPRGRPEHRRLPLLHHKFDTGHTTLAA